MAQPRSSSMPGPRTLELWRLRRRFGRNPLDLFPELRRRYGSVVRLKAGARTIFLISDPAVIEAIFTTHNASFAKGTPLARTRQLLGSGLLTSEGDLWRSERRILQPAFHAARLPEYAAEIVRITDQHTGRWWHQDRHNVGQEMLDLTLYAVSKTVLGSDIGSVSGQVGSALGVAMQHFQRQNRGVFTLPVSWPTPANRRLRRAVQSLHGIVLDLIARRRAAPAASGDVLDLLLAARDGEGNPLPDALVRDEVMTMLLAGHETTANTLTFALALLSENPDSEQSLHAELDAVLGGRSPSLADLARLPYTDAVVKEVLRLYPAAWTVARQAQERVEVQGVEIPKGSDLLLCQWLVHRDPDLFPKPLQFRPERWLGDETKALPRFAYFPFGGGQRLCIGRDFALLEARLVLATLAQRYRMRVLTPFPRLDAAVTLRPAQRVVAEIEVRDAVSGTDTAS